MDLIEVLKRKLVISVIIICSIVIGSTYKFVDSFLIQPLELNNKICQNILTEKENKLNDYKSMIDKLEKYNEQLKLKSVSESEIKRENNSISEEKKQILYILKQKEQEIDLLQRQMAAENNDVSNSLKICQEKEKDNRLQVNKLERDLKISESRLHSCNESLIKLSAESNNSIILEETWVEDGASIICFKGQVLLSIRSRISSLAEITLTFPDSTTKTYEVSENSKNRFEYQGKSYLLYVLAKKFNHPPTAIYNGAENVWSYSISIIKDDGLVKSQN